MVYQVGMHRCTLHSSNTHYKQAESHIFYTVPMILLVTLYSIMLVHIVRHKTCCKKLLLTSVAVCTAGVVVAIPEVISNTSVSWDYRAIQLITVLPLYVTPLCNSMIYYCSNPLIQKQILARDVWNVLINLYECVFKNMSRGPMGGFSIAHQTQMHCQAKYQVQVPEFEETKQIREDVCEVRNHYFGDTDVVCSV